MLFELLFLIFSWAAMTVRNTQWKRKLIYCNQTRRADDFFFLGLFTLCATVTDNYSEPETISQQGWKLNWTWEATQHWEFQFCFGLEQAELYLRLAQPQFYPLQWLADDATLFPFHAAAVQRLQALQQAAVFSSQSLQPCDHLLRVAQNRFCRQHGRNFLIQQLYREFKKDSVRTRLVTNPAILAKFNIS